MVLLAIDTSTHFSAVCVFDSATDRELAVDSRNIGRGHAELLMEQVDNCLSSSDVRFEDIDRIGVACGPGSFTGIRVGVAAARGFGLGLRIPVIGVSCLDACEAAAIRMGATLPLLSVLEAGRDQYYCKLSSEETAILASAREDFDKYAGITNSFAGSGAEFAARFVSQSPEIIHTDATAPIITYARLASGNLDTLSGPEPIYLRPADAKPQAGFVLQKEAD